LGSEICIKDSIEPTKFNNINDKREKLAYFLEGLEIFEELFGYRSASIIPPNYTWSPEWDQEVFNRGVKYFQGIRKMREPRQGGKYKNHHLFLGKKNQYGQVYLIRNVVFEPSLFALGITDPVGQCLYDMSVAFKTHKPVVITSHRVNYVGYIDKTNRDRTLRMLTQLITTALDQWPEIEFMTSLELGNIINSEKG